MDFLGWQLQRHGKPGTTRDCVYSYPAKKALAAVRGEVKALCQDTSVNQPSDDLLRRLNVMLRGWCGYLPGRRVFGDLRLPEPLHVADGLAAAAATHAPTDPPRRLRHPNRAGSALSLGSVGCQVRPARGQAQASLAPGMPLVGGACSSHTGFPTPMMVPPVVRTWGRTKQEALVLTVTVAMPVEPKVAAGRVATVWVTGSLPV